MIALGLLLVFCIISYVITNRILIKIISKFFEKTSTKSDDILIEKGFFNKISNFIPLIIFYNLFNHFFGIYPLINRLLLVLISIVVILSINSLLNALNAIYNQNKDSSKVNIKSYLQIIKLIIIK